MWSGWTLGRVDFKSLLVPLWDLSEVDGAPSWNIDHDELLALDHFTSHFRLKSSGSVTLKPFLSQYGVARGALASPSPANQDDSDF